VSVSTRRGKGRARIVYPGRTAGAATLATPFLSANNEQRVACQVTNIGATPVIAQITLRDGVGQVLTPLFDNCNQPIDPQQRCSVFLAQFKQTYCSINSCSSSSNVRGAMAVFARNTDVLLVVPATKWGRPVGRAARRGAAARHSGYHPASGATSLGHCASLSGADREGDTPKGHDEDGLRFTQEGPPPRQIRGLNAGDGVAGAGHPSRRSGEAAG